VGQGGGDFREPGHDCFSAGQRGDAQHRGYFGPQSTAGDQHEPLSAFGELVSSLQGHPATQTVSNQRGPMMPECDQQIPHRTGMRAQ
jgi:hypothetical protein